MCKMMITHQMLYNSINCSLLGYDTFKNGVCVNLLLEGVLKRNKKEAIQLGKQTVMSTACVPFLFGHISNAM